MISNNIKEILKKLPNESGVYIYKDANGTVIYVGKAKSLKNRVRSYFNSTEQNYKTRVLISNIADINYIVTANELEALLLENNLIKKYKPKYNILLKDDKGYPYLRINPKTSFPKLELARKIKYDGALYFGPYHGATSARIIQDIATEIYPLRTCSYDLNKRKNIKPCLKYHINRCPAPCINKDINSYKKNVNGIISFLKGNDSNVQDILKDKMLKASENLEFERAAELRDKIVTINEILNKQKIVLDKNQNIDIISVLIRDNYGVICSLFIRSGRLIGVNTVEQENLTYEDEKQLISQYLIQHYYDGAYIPDEIITDYLPEDKEIIEQLLYDIKGKKVNIKLAMRGKKHELILMAKRNAKEKLDKSYKSIQYKENRVNNGLDKLKNILNLEKTPERIECFDISHIQGTDTVASMVVLTNGTPNKKEYRRFKVHQGNNDYASMQEVVSRRFNDYLSLKKGFDKKPDLVVIDGGVGQLNSANEIIKKLNLNLKLIGLAEKYEEIYLPYSPVPLILERSDPSLQIIQTIRDEAHRFAITYHKSLRNKRTLNSTLDEIIGIGTKRKKALMKAFLTVSRIKEASLQELEQVNGMNKQSAQAVYDYYKNKKD